MSRGFRSRLTHSNGHSGPKPAAPRWVSHGSAAGVPRGHPPRHAAGTTLIEVLAGLVILGTLLVSLAIARGRFVRTWADADRRIAATRVADELVAGWLSGSPSAVPLSSQGFTDDAPRRLWRTSLVPDADARSIGTVVVRLQVFENAAATAPLCQVDFLLRDPRLQPRTTTGGRP